MELWLRTVFGWICEKFGQKTEYMKHPAYAGCLKRRQNEARCDKWGIIMHEKMGKKLMVKKKKKCELLTDQWWDCLRERFNVRQGSYACRIGMWCYWLEPTFERPFILKDWLWCIGGFICDAVAALRVRPNCAFNLHWDVDSRHSHFKNLFS